MVGGGPTFAAHDALPDRTGHESQHSECGAGDSIDDLRAYFEGIEEISAAIVRMIVGRGLPDSKVSDPGVHVAQRNVVTMTAVDCRFEYAQLDGVKWPRQSI